MFKILYLYVSPSTTGAYRLNFKSAQSIKISGERKSFLQAMVCLINFLNINFGHQKDKPTAEATFQMLGFEEVGSKWFEWHALWQL